MSRLSEWLRHRQLMLGLRSQEDLAEAAAISADQLERIFQTGTLRHTGRSARAWLARALKVTVRDLELLSFGGIEWIDDSHIVDFERLVPAPLRICRDTLTDEPSAIPCPVAHGVPIVGRILYGGTAEFYGDPSAIELDRLPLRYRAMPDAFALHMVERDEPYAITGVLIFNALPPGQIGQNQIALITRDDTADSIVGQVAKNSASRLCLLTQDGREISMPLEAVVRAATVVGSHPF